MTNDTHTLQPIAVNEAQAASLLGLSVHFLQKDRRTKRLIPFYKIGSLVRYNLDRMREALARFEEGDACIPQRIRAMGKGCNNKSVGAV